MLFNLPADVVEAFGAAAKPDHHRWRGLAKGALEAGSAISSRFNLVHAKRGWNGFNVCTWPLRAWAG
jgi:NADH-quinone oxidoreductase subunit G